MDHGTILASSFFPILMLIVFITTVVVVVNTIVAEKELRLKEGMLVMGLNPFVYWYTWFACHWFIITISSVIYTFIGLYVFEESNPGILFLFYLVWTASLIFFSYFISVFFNSAKVCKCTVHSLARSAFCLISVWTILQFSGCEHSSTVSIYPSCCTSYHYLAN